MLICFCVAVGAFAWWANRPVRHGPGVIAPDKPRQQALSNHQPFRFNGYTLLPKAAFDIRARVLSKRRYRIGWGTDLCPIDLAMGWGPMSDEAVLKAIKIDQYNRYYVWSAKQLPVPLREIELSSANIHIVPASLEVRKLVLACRVGHLVRFSGYLVDVTGADGARRTTSLTREDTGANACEIVFVKAFDVLQEGAPGRE